ncbi:VanZ family protein [Agromyces subbeticus]|uniref:VanZ family protein n=1 Tax=Agromyces subbeticus TaxID=293890 RepID=UPI0003B4FE9A|nr:VanZ family protein [Agromyces subbeticus]
MESDDEQMTDAARPSTEPRSQPHDRLRRTARVLLVPYVVLLALIVFSPAQDAARVTGFVWWAADLLASWGVPRRPAAVVLEFVANIALFIPLGMLVRLAFDRVRSWWIVVAGFLASAFIELVQLAIPSRVATASDVIANTLGVAVGVAIVFAIAGGTRSHDVSRRCAR